MGLTECSDKDDDQLTIRTRSSTAATAAWCYACHDARATIASGKDFAEIIEACGSTSTTTGRVGSSDAAMVAWRSIDTDRTTATTASIHV